jgi:CRP/FNR family transcriptional regulator, nitrogen fixation regulation protein
MMSSAREGTSAFSNSTGSVDEATYEKGGCIFCEGDRAEYVYQVKTGAVRSFNSLSDGRRQIKAFHLPGDIFGVTSEDNHRFKAEAVVETTLMIFKREELANADAALVQHFLQLTAISLHHAEEQLLLLGRKESVEKVAAFLLEMHQRVAILGAVTLPMTRRDIADYLGLTIETVSRALAKLRKAGAISIAKGQEREIKIVSRKRLLALASESAE